MRVRCPSCDGEKTITRPLEPPWACVVCGGKGHVVTDDAQKRLESELYTLRAENERLRAIINAMEGGEAFGAITNSYSSNSYSSTETEEG